MLCLKCRLLYSKRLYFRQLFHFNLCLLFNRWLWPSRFSLRATHRSPGHAQHILQLIIFNLLLLSCYSLCNDLDIPWNPSINTARLGLLIGYPHIVSFSFNGVILDAKLDSCVSHEEQGGLNTVLTFDWVEILRVNVIVDGWQGFRQDIRG